MQVVHYKDAGFPIHIGSPALVWPLDHPRTDRVSNQAITKTSTVVAHDYDSGAFVTLNTLYIRVGKC